MFDLAVRLLKGHEGFRAKPYRCTAGKLTIGYGRNLDDQGVTTDEAEYLLRNDIKIAVANLRLESYWLDLSETRQAVLINMVVNLGWPRFSKFAKLRAALNAKDYRQASAEMLDSLWADQVGGRAIDLSRMMRYDA